MRLKLVADDFVDLWDGSIPNSIGFDESSLYVNPNSRVLTGSNSGGAFDAEACNDWTSASSGLSYRYGSLDYTYSWFSIGNNACDIPGRLYCMSQ